MPGAMIMGGRENGGVELGLKVFYFFIFSFFHFFICVWLGLRHGND